MSDSNGRDRRYSDFKALKRKELKEHNDFITSFFFFSSFSKENLHTEADLEVQ